MFDPNNNHQLYEGHLQEATLNLNWTTKSFHRRHVNNVTNAVMSPVNMVKPDFSVSTLNCHGSSKSKLDLLVLNALNCIHVLITAVPTVWGNLPPKLYLGRGWCPVHAIFLVARSPVISKRNSKEKSGCQLLVNNEFVKYKYFFISIISHHTCISFVINIGLSYKLGMSHFFRKITHVLNAHWMWILNTDIFCDKQTLNCF